MTREEAIRIIGWLKCTTNREDDLEAIDMAIEALYHHTEKTANISTKVKSDLISRADAIEAVQSLYYTDRKKVLEAIKALPSADRPQGEWVCKDSADMSVFWYECSECGEQTPRNNYNQEYKSNYCPNCGARMRMEE